MPVSHHSHSGEFCCHAKNTLEEMVLEAKSYGMKGFALTEHMPREFDEDLYPEEIDAGMSIAKLAQQFHDFIAEALRLRAKYNSDTFCITIGFETEWIRSSSLDLINQLWTIYEVDFVVGSVHHVHTIPIDLDKEMYNLARQKSGGKDIQLFADYFDCQYEMLRAVKPRIIGHFDLIRLYSDTPDLDLRQVDAIWSKIMRNLTVIAAYGGIMEINTSALRKGMAQPYPRAEICEAFKEMHGRFTLSDDSHSVDQIGFSYATALSFLSNLGVQELALVQSRTMQSSLLMPLSAKANQG